MNSTFYLLITPTTMSTTTTPTAKTTLETTIPFDGFYYSHSEIIVNHALDIEDDYNIREANEQLPTETNEQYNDRIQKLFEEHCDNAPYNEACIQYSKEYVKAFANDNNIKLTYVDIDRPKEYNFTTDRIFCTIELKEVKRLIEACNKIKLAELIKQIFTSRDGFSSYYSSDIAEWPLHDPKQLDHNQIGTIIECYTAEHIAEQDDDYPYIAYLMGDFCF